MHRPRAQCPASPGARTVEPPSLLLAGPGLSSVLGRAGLRGAPVGRCPGSPHPCPVTAWDLLTRAPPASLPHTHGSSEWPLCASPGDSRSSQRLCSPTSLPRRGGRPARGLFQATRGRAGSALCLPGPYPWPGLAWEPVQAVGPAPAPSPSRTDPGQAAVRSPGSVPRPEAPPRVLTAETSPSHPSRSGTALSPQAARWMPALLVLRVLALIRIVFPECNPAFELGTLARARSGSGWRGGPEPPGGKAGVAPSWRLPHLAGVYVLVACVHSLWCPRVMPAQVCSQTSACLEDRPQEPRQVEAPGPRSPVTSHTTVCPTSSDPQATSPVPAPASLSTSSAGSRAGDPT